MKKYFFSAIFIIFIMTMTSAGFAQVQQPLDNFWGIKWGTDVETTKTIIKTKKNCEIEYIDDENIMCAGKFGGMEATITFNFHNKKLCKGFVMYPYEINRAIRNYNEIKSNLIEKYGTPKFDIENFKSPYHSGDGYEEQAIRLHKANFAATWIFSDANKLGILITDTLKIAVMYINTQVDEKIKKEEHKENMSDF